MAHSGQGMLITPITRSTDSVIREAAGGDAGARQRFARRYEQIVRSYLLARWGGSPLAQELDDVIQEVFVEAYRDGGVLERADQQAPGGFRAFFYGVIRNVALRPIRHGKQALVQATVLVDQLHYYKTASGTVTLTLTDAQGRQVSAQSVGGSPGDVFPDIGGTNAHHLL